jgi:N-acylneuraminate cytidylyltransferase
VRYLCVIPARGGSTEIVGKNIRLLHGKPLIAWTIEHALAARFIDRVLVSTDNAQIAELSKAAGAEVPFRRPDGLATDDSPTEPTLLHALSHVRDEGYEPDAVVLLQATSPVRRPTAVDEAITQFEDTGADSLFSASPVGPFIWRGGDVPISLYDYGKRLRRQDLSPENEYFRETGSIYITRAAVLDKAHNRLGGTLCMYRMSAAEGVDIDHEFDLQLAEWYLAQELDWSNS